MTPPEPDDDSGSSGPSELTRTEAPPRAARATLLPALTGEEDSASSGLLLVLVNAVVGMLPSILGESGSMQNLGSAGQFLCTLSPSLLGGESLGDTDTETGGGEALGSAPSALLGMFTTGAGSLGD